MLGLDEIATHLDHKSRCKTAYSTNWSNRWIYREFVMILTANRCRCVDRRRHARRALVQTWDAVLGCRASDSVAIGSLPHAGSLFSLLGLRSRVLSPRRSYSGKFFAFAIWPGLARFIHFNLEKEFRGPASNACASESSGPKPKPTVEAIWPMQGCRGSILALSSM